MRRSAALNHFGPTVGKTLSRRFLRGEWYCSAHQTPVLLGRLDDQQATRFRPPRRRRTVTTLTWRQLSQRGAGQGVLQQGTSRRSWFGRNVPPPPGRRIKRAATGNNRAFAGTLAGYDFEFAHSSHQQVPGGMHVQPGAGVAAAPGGFAVGRASVAPAIRLSQLLANLASRSPIPCRRRVHCSRRAVTGQNGLLLFSGEG